MLKLPNNVQQNEHYDLLMDAYAEDYNQWCKDVGALEQRLLKLQKELWDLDQLPSTWWEQLLAHLPQRVKAKQQRIAQLERELDQVQQQYERRIKEEPSADRYKLALLGNNVFKVSR